MRRLTTPGAEWIGVCVVVLAMSMVASARSAVRSTASCPRQASVVVARGPLAVVYATDREIGAAYFGCTTGRKSFVKLGPPERRYCGSFQTCYVSAAAVHGTAVIYGLTFAPEIRGISTAQIVVRDLTTRKVLVRQPAFDVLSSGPSDTSRRDGVVSIVAASRRSFAWISRNPTAVPGRYEVWLSEAGRRVLVGAGRGIAPHSLRLVRGTLSWRVNGATRTAPLGMPAPGQRVRPNS